MYSGNLRGVDGCRVMAEHEGQILRFPDSVSVLVAWHLPINVSPGSISTSFFCRLEDERCKTKEFVRSIVFPVSRSLNRKASLKDDARYWWLYIPRQFISRCSSAVCNRLHSMLPVLNFIAVVLTELQGCFLPYANTVRFNLFWILPWIAVLFKSVMLVMFWMSTLMLFCLTPLLTRLPLCLAPLLTPRHQRGLLECLFVTLLTVVEFWTTFFAFAFAFLIDVCALEGTTVNVFLFVKVALLLVWLNTLVEDTLSLPAVALLAGAFTIRPFATGHWIIIPAKNVDRKKHWKRQRLKCRKNVTFRSLVVSASTFENVGQKVVPCTKRERQYKGGDR